MRKETFRRGTAAYNLAKAQGRLPSQIAAKKKAAKVAPKKQPVKSAPKTKPVKTAPKTKPVKTAPKKQGSTTRTGAVGSTKGSKTSNKPNNGAGSTTRTGAGKQDKNRRLFGNLFGRTFTSRRGPNR